VKYVGLGARTIVAEGAEPTALGVLDGGSTSQMVGSYRAQVDSAFANGSSVDPVTGLPGEPSFFEVLAETFEAGTIPTVGYVDLGLADRRSTLGVSTVNGIRRRFTSSLLDLAEHRDAHVYDLGGVIAFISPTLSSETTPTFVQAVLQLGRMFKPLGVPLDVAVGTAHPETAGDPDELVALVERALEVARNVPERTMDADSLGDQGTAALELEAALHVADAVDALDPRGAHQARVADLAVQLARHLEVDPATVAAMGLAARLHDVGKVPFGAEAFDEESERHDESRMTHPETGALFVSLAAGDEVAAIIRGHHERWDGEGNPDGLAGADIPLGARLVATVDRLDDLKWHADPLTDLAERLREEAGTVLDPELVEAAIEAFGL
jgi:response regulator RpfG family c-di-GMP phosphodiesterase